MESGGTQMREQHHLLQLCQRWVDGRFLLIDVEPCAGDGARCEGIDQRVFIDDRTTCCIDEKGSRAHPGQFARADQMVGSRRKRSMNCQNISFSEEIVQRSVLPLTRER